jgi:hypothetical protein
MFTCKSIDGQRRLRSVESLSHSRVELVIADGAPKSRLRVRNWLVVTRRARRRDHSHPVALPAVRVVAVFGHVSGRR